MTTIDPSVSGIGTGGGSGWMEMTGAEFHQFCLDTVGPDEDETKAVEFYMGCGGVSSDPFHMVSVQIHGYCRNTVNNKYYPRDCNYTAVEAFETAYYPILAGPGLDDELIFSDGALHWNGVVVGHDGNLTDPIDDTVSTVICRVVDWLTGGGEHELGWWLADRHGVEWLLSEGVPA